MDNDITRELADVQFKGLSPAIYGRTLGELVDLKVGLFDGTFSPPVMTLYGAALENNIATMAAYCSDRGVELAPHGKTTLAPQLFRRQIAAGAWGISVATPDQIALCRSSGIRRIFLANEFVDQDAIAWVLSELADDRDFEFLCYIDSVEGVRLIADGLRAARTDRPFDVVIEVGYRGGRTGCRSREAAREVAEAAAGVSGLRVVGVAGYEGGMGHELSDDVLRSVREYLGFVHSVASDLTAAGLVIDSGSGVILSAGGSLFFDEVVEAFSQDLLPGQRPRVLLRCGSYVSHDSGIYSRLSPFTRPGASPSHRLIPALRVWGQVLSCPEAGLALVNIGRRDTAFDDAMPTPEVARRGKNGPLRDVRACSVSTINDQHAFVTVPGAMDLRVGDWVGFGISHPSTAFDKSRLLPVVDEDYRVIDFIRTYF
jgi:D-serine deaminase-like pyridoxal phosphate-dependent protein